MVECCYWNTCAGWNKSLVEWILVKFIFVSAIFSDGRMYMMLVKEALGFVIRFDGV